jgi:hypothetical protein
VWQSPVGGLYQIGDLTRHLTTDDVAALTEASVNPLVVFPELDFRVWGARTTSTDPEWKYVPVRRFVSFLEESIQEGTSWAVFEPNDEPLWAALRVSITTFLEELWRDGAIEGTAPDDAFFVRCDQSTMTQADLDAGRTIALVGVAPLRPAEFIVIRIMHERGGSAVFTGDTNNDASIDVGDAITILSHLFAGGPRFPCYKAADVNDDNAVDIGDGITLLGFLFGGGNLIAPDG